MCTRHQSVATALHFTSLLLRRSILEVKSNRNIRRRKDAAVRVIIVSISMRVVSNPRATASNYSELAPQRQVAGSSAIINPSSNHSEKKMANMSDLPDDAEIAPTHHFVPIPPAHSAHYPQPAYSFPRGNGNFAAEQDIQMAQELSHDMQQGVGDAAPTSAPSNNSHGQNHAMDISSTPMGPGMGPPSNRQSFSGNPQSAVDVTPDQTMMGDGKRKRSKVSRACDECRRKKVRKHRLLPSK